MNFVRRNILLGFCMLQPLVVSVGAELWRQEVFFCETPDSTSKPPERLTPQHDEHLPTNSMVGVVNIPPSGSPAGILLGVVGFG